MNDVARGELESLFTEGDEYDPLASIQIILSVMMGYAWQNKRLYGIATLVLQLSCDIKTLGKPAGKAALRQLLTKSANCLKSLSL